MLIRHVAAIMDKKVACEEEWPGGKLVKDGITYDTKDPNTVLIGYREPGAEYLPLPAGQKPTIPAIRLYYNTLETRSPETRYFLHKRTKDGEIEAPIDVATARHYMDKELHPLCTSEDEIERIKQSDGFDRRR